MYTKVANIADSSNNSTITKFKLNEDDDQKLDNYRVVGDYSPYNLKEDQTDSDDMIQTSINLLSLDSLDLNEPDTSYQESNVEDGVCQTMSRFASTFDAYRRGNKDMITSTNQEPKILRVIQWGKFKGMIDDRMVRCPHQMSKTRCHCTFLPIVPSKLRQFTRPQELSRSRRQVYKRRSFNNLSFQFSYSDENSPSLSSEGDSAYISYTNSFRKRLHYYKEINGLKLRRHISGAVGGDTENKGASSF